MIKRIENNANTKEEVIQYFQTRARQVLSDNFFWSTIINEVPGGYETTFTNKDTGEEFSSIYMLEQNRGKGYYKGISKTIKNKIITVPDCNIENYLKDKHIDYVLAGKFIESHAYKMVEKFYGDQKANRSQCFLMNHIDEGLAIMSHMEMSNAAKEAFCIHPLIQNNEALAQNWKMVYSEVSSEVIGLAMEYRNIANSYLSKRKIKNIDEIELSPLTEVNGMLKADKIQNYKDFLKYHINSHERAKELDIYFKNWLKKLNITTEEFTNYFFVLNSIEIS